jgi:hypothetical protein
VSLTLPEPSARASMRQPLLWLRDNKHSNSTSNSSSTMAAGGEEDITDIEATPVFIFQNLILLKKKKKNFISKTNKIQKPKKNLKNKNKKNKK